MPTRFLHDHLPRILISSLFIASAILFMAIFERQVEFMSLIVGSSLAFMVVLLAIIIKLVCGIMILVNWKTSIAASILVVFLIVATGVEHSNWFDAGGLYNLLQFFRNLAIIGGLLFLITKPDSSPVQE
ncbi:MAG: DoxX family membrane protein [Patescibacteria group bacterium]